jgi:2,3-bisphosphoglycerate-independent phosphoglycerate mutase
VSEKSYVLIIPDGAPDVQRLHGRSPLQAAHTPHQDWVAREGVCGLMQTQYEDLPRGSIVAQLGMLGWDPRYFQWHGRAAWELLALGGASAGPDDLVFRANFVHLAGRALRSYNAGFIRSEQAAPLVERLNREMRQEFPDFELYHNSDFRNSLVVRGAGLDPLLFDSPEPHESEGAEIDPVSLVSGADTASQALAARINRYVVRSGQILAGSPANLLLPWSASRMFCLPSFRDNTGFEGSAAIVGCVDFLGGIARAAEIEFHRLGNGRPDTDYAGKGRKVVELLAAGCSLVICHVNAPDEAAHMHDRDSKVLCIEAIDAWVVGPVLDYFRAHGARLGGLMVAPDHYTNLLETGSRTAAHSLHPVPFALWNARDRDAARRFDEDAVRAGRYASPPVSHLDLLRLLGVGAARAKARPRCADGWAEPLPP